MQCALISSCMSYRCAVADLLLYLYDSSVLTKDKQLKDAFLERLETVAFLIFMSSLLLSWQ